jgi:hypothetical protein
MAEEKVEQAKPQEQDNKTLTFVITLDTKTGMTNFSMPQNQIIALGMLALAQRAIFRTLDGDGMPHKPEIRRVAEMPMAKS